MLLSDFNAAVFELEKHLYYIKQELNDIGYCYYTTATAPQTFKDLDIIVTKQGNNQLIKIPVYSKYSDNTIFSDPKYNYVLRFWHDYCHLLLDLDFSYENEVFVAEYQLGWLESRGASATACKLLWWDLVGQGEYHKRYKEFPSNQKAFVQSCAYHGIKNACLAKH